MKILIRDKYQNEDCSLANAHLANEVFTKTSQCKIGREKKGYIHVINIGSF
jgi:hypothetical protein